MTRSGVDGDRLATLASRADVAQLVEHHLAKVRVAGSNPVVRSRKVQVTALREAKIGPSPRVWSSAQICSTFPVYGPGTCLVKPVIGESDRSALTLHKCQASLPMFMREVPTSEPVITVLGS
jgi:hypothetical protein